MELRFEKKITHLFGGEMCYMEINNLSSWALAIVVLYS